MDKIINIEYLFITTIFFWEILSYVFYPSLLIYPSLIYYLRLLRKYSYFSLFSTSFYLFVIEKGYFYRNCSKIAILF